MNEIPIYIDDNNMLTVAKNQLKKEVIVNDPSQPRGYRIEKKTLPTQLIGYLEGAEGVEAVLGEEDKS